MFGNDVTRCRFSTFPLQIMIFSRPIKDCPLFIEVTEHNPPLISFGARGTKEKGFMQPCNVTVDARNNVFVVDTVRTDMQVKRKLESSHMNDRS